MTNHTDSRVVATVRRAGARNVHTVTADGVVVATRRSEHAYAYAICRWVTRNDIRTVDVIRWSNNSRAAGRRNFAVSVAPVA